LAEVAAILGAILRVGGADEVGVDTAEGVLEIHPVAGAVVVLLGEDLESLSEWNMQPL
jgi:hypothetical protein